MIKLIEVKTNFVDGSKQSEMNERIEELQDTYRIINKEDGLENEIQDIVEDYLIEIGVWLNPNNISTMNPIPSKDRMTIRMNCGPELTIDETIEQFVKRLKEIK